MLDAYEPELVNGKTWLERWAEVLAGVGCVCGRHHDTDDRRAHDDGHEEAHPRR